MRCGAQPRFHASWRQRRGPAALPGQPRRATLNARSSHCSHKRNASASRQRPAWGHASVEILPCSGPAAKVRQ
eukprot:11123283-Alexandrium_andersonii.AAC.1